MNCVNFALESVGLRRSICELFESGKAQTKGMAHISYNIEGLLPGDQDSERFDLIVAVEIEVEGRETDTKEKVFQVSTRHHGGFKCLNGDKPDPNDELLIFDLSKEVFPVAREHANQLLTQMGFRNVYLPWSVDPRDREAITEGAGD